MYVYLISERDCDDKGNNLYTVGFFDPNDKWHPEMDTTDKEEAAERVHWLNGGESKRNDKEG